MSAAGISLERPRSSRIACRKCHARKVKCSGGLPCTNCQQANVSVECTYPNRIRRVRVEQRYIDELLDEIHRLRQTAQVPETSRSSHSSTPRSIGGPSSAEPSDSAPSKPSTTVSARTVEPVTPQAGDATHAHEVGEAVRNPLLDDSPWCFALIPEIPILIGEATDVAFATRFRQEILGKSQSHFLRPQTVHDETLSSLWKSERPWPAPSRARFLLKVALSTICQRYYLVRKSSTCLLLEQAIHNPAMCDLLSTCKLYALFALGEAYSIRTYSSEDQFPGIGYYVNATRMLRVLSEQPRIDCVEIMVMLSIYSLTMNRRHCAYCIVGYAIRFSIILGLHLNVPQHHLSPDLQEHRNRVWWTAYILDRSWACMLGKPVSIQDEDICVSLPSALDLPSDSASEDFADTDYLTASLRIANLGAQITASIYSRRTHRTSFSSRVQQALRDLGSWLQELPEPLRAAMNQVPPKAIIPTITLYLYFNHCLILASRPVLLYSLRLHRSSSRARADREAAPISETASSLSEACIQCARRSYRILTDSWIDGTFPTFDYAYTQYLFSSAIILAISSLFQSHDSHNDGDRDDFEAAAQILDQLDQSGNFAAKEFSKHVEATKLVLEKIALERGQLVDGHCPLPPSAANYGMPQLSHEGRILADPSTDGSRLPLAEPPLQDLLLQPELDLRFLEPSIIGDGFQAFNWPQGEGVEGGWENGWDNG
ncbi:hypothetical protein FDECE_4599 [Fusarium decemcellulare]|nr:hypothetical protein FDECE_4599 [Fusarium decemcellulare]